MLLLWIGPYTELRSDRALLIDDSSNVAVLLLMMAEEEEDFGGVRIKNVEAAAVVVNAALAWPRRVDREINGTARATVEEICRKVDSTNEIIVRYGSVHLIISLLHRLSRGTSESSKRGSLNFERVLFERYGMVW